MEHLLGDGFVVVARKHYADTDNPNYSIFLWEANYKEGYDAFTPESKIVHTISPNYWRNF